MTTRLQEHDGDDEDDATYRHSEVGFAGPLPSHRAPHTSLGTHRGDLKSFISRQKTKAAPCLDSCPLSILHFLITLFSVYKAHSLCSSVIYLIIL